MLAERYKPDTAGGELGDLSGILNLTKEKTMDKMLETLDAWEKKIAEYEDKKGEELDEAVKVELLIKMAPETVATNLRFERSSGRLGGYAEARREVVNLEPAAESDTKNREGKQYGGGGSPMERVQRRHQCD